MNDLKSTYYLYSFIFGLGPFRHCGIASLSLTRDVLAPLS